MKQKYSWWSVLLWVAFACVAVFMSVKSSIVSMDTGRSRTRSPAYQQPAAIPDTSTAQRYEPVTTPEPVDYPSADYKYNHRTGTSGDYTYNYDVYGNNVNGNCDMHGKYGECAIIDDDGNTQHVEAEWVRKGVVEVTDEAGNRFEMEVE